MPTRPDDHHLKTDPTKLTTDQLLREINGLKELIDARIDAMEKATDLRIQAVDRIPGDTKDEVQHLRELLSERFESVYRQFNERDIRTQQASDAVDVRTQQAATASADALAAALQAAKELVGAQGEASAAAAVKSETSFTKQIDQIGTIIQTLEKALDARITELKERIDRGEGNTQGIASNKVGMYALAGFILTILIIVNVLAANGVLGSSGSTTPAQTTTSVTK